MIFDPNPLFYEMVRIFKENYSKDNKVVICNEGSSRCFGPNTVVKTSVGPKNITEIKPGDLVQTYNEQSKKIEFNKVQESLQMVNKKPCLRIKLKNGDIIEATEDHEFYYKGSWCTLKHVVSLWNESKNINKR